MPMFQWDKVDKESSEIGVKLLPQFNLYWAITVPLTVVTFMLYFVWLWFQKREFREKTDANKKKTEEFLTGGKVAEVEIQRLEQKRRETSM